MIPTIHSVFKPAVLVIIAVIAALDVHAEGMRTLRGHVPPADALSRPLGAFPETNTLRLAISLPLRNRDRLEALLQRLYDPASLEYHRFLTPAQFSEQFGPTAQDYQKVVQFARSNGFQIAASRDSRMLLDVSAKVSDAERAFHVVLRNYQHPSEPRTFHAPDVEPSLDSDLPILEVAGLSDYSVPHPMVRRKLDKGGPAPALGSQSGGNYLGSDFRNAYAPGVSLTGTGQMVGLLELDGYYPSDISAYETLAGLPNVPLQNVVIDGFTGPPGSGNTEVSLDIEMAIAMAPGLSAVVVFEAPDSNIGYFEDLFDSMASSNQIKQFSCSWSYNSFFDGDPTIDSALQKMASQGQSFFQASGDGDAWTSPIQVPDDSPYLTSVGGTFLEMSGTGAGYSSETVWNEGFVGVKYEWTPNGKGYIGSGGGVSGIYSIPSWQQGVHTSANNASTTMRNIPDVALTADDVWITYGNGLSESVAGTSCAAPLWAGFIALVNQQAAAGGSPTVGFINPAVYALGKGTSYTSTFHDITTGNNTNAQSTGLYSATSGYDLCTGWGTPNGTAFINALSPEPLQISPSAGFTSTGLPGGPFSVSSQNFTLTNVAPASLNWAAGSTSPWLSVTPGSGALVFGSAAATVTVSLNSSASQLGAGSYSGTVSFTNLNDTVVQTFRFNLTVSTTATTLSWNNPAGITYGTALNSSQLDATADVPGSFAYNPPAGAVLNSGNNVLSVTFTPTDTTDYTTATGTVNLAVARAALTVTAANASRPYGQANPVFTGTIAGLQNNDNITATYGSSATTSSSVGSYAIAPALVDPANRQTNYIVNPVNGTLSITQAAPQVAWNNPASITYGTQLSAGQLNATANVPGTFAYNPPTGTALNSGNNVLSVTFTPTDTTDYTTVTSMVNLAVVRASLTVTAANASRPYGQANPAFTGTIVGLQNNDNITATYSSSATTSSPAGSYAIAPALVDPANRQTNYTVTPVNGALSVTQALPQVTWNSPVSITYGTQLSAGQLNATANVPGSFAYNPPAGAVLNSGTNVISVTFTPTDITDYTTAISAVNLVVAPASLTVTVASANRSYGQANPPFTGTIVGLQNNDDITATLSSSATITSPVGSYAITPMLVDPGNRQTNYTVTPVNGTLSVTQALSQVTWNNPASVTYGTQLGAGQLNATASAPGTFAYNPPAGTVLNSGTNVLSVTFTPTDTTDYTTVISTVNLVVAPASLTVTVANANRPYGQANPAFTGTIVGLQNNDNITATYSSIATISSPVGSYAIMPTLVDPANRQTNYTVTPVNGTLSVTQALPLVTWNSPVSITYGTALSAGQLNATASAPGTFAYNPPAGTVLNSGTNVISVNFTPTDITDYTTVISTVNLVVATAPLTVTAANANRPYGQANPVFTGTIAGLQNNDNITATYSSSATISSPVGSYTITPTLVDPANRQTNYTVTPVNGTLSVTQALPLVTWNSPVSITYGTALGAGQLNATANVPGSFAYNPPVGAALNSGINALSVTFTPMDTTDYTTISSLVILVVARAPLTVTADGANRPYGQANPAFTGTIVGLQNNDNITATYSSSATISSPVGSYSVTPTLVDPANRQTNYTVSLVNGTLSVAQASPQVTWNNPVSITYGTALNAGQLNATANVPGSFAYNPPVGAVLNSGINALSVTFTPTDTTDYNTVTSTANLAVARASLTVTAASANRSYGQANPAFTGTIVGLQNNDNITATYGSSATISSPVGSYPITPTLVDPANRQTNYAVSLINGALSVAQALPQVTWNNPVSVTYGTALGAGQLNAAANAPGTFAYNPPSGTMLNSGINALSVTFTPTDTTDYTTVTSMVNLVVARASLSVTAANTNRPYGQANPAFTGTIVGLQNNDNITATYNSIATISSPIGSYAITPALVDPANRQTNYNVSLVNGMLSVAAPPPQAVFTRIRNYPNATNWVDVTPNAGDTLVVVANCYGTVFPTISDNLGNQWKVLQTVQGSSGTNAVTLMVAVALNVQGASTRITVPIASATTLEMVEYSGITAVDTSASASGATLAAAVSTSSTDMFFAAWLNKAAFANTSTSLSPGSVVGKPIRYDTNYYDGQYEWLNGGFGLPANNYTLKMITSDTNGTWVVVALTAPPPPTSPSITAQPESQTVIATTPASFSGTTTGTAPLSIQWFDGATAIPGATNNTLSWTSVAQSNAGGYFFTVSNAAGVVTSSIATLTVLPTNTIATAAGVYNALFFQTNAAGLPAVTETNAGFLGNCVVASNGTFSAKLYLDGVSCSLAGVFGITGNTTVTIPNNTNGLSNLVAQLQLDLIGGTGQMTGAISCLTPGSSWTSPLLGELASNALPQLGGADLLLTPEAGGNAPTSAGSASGLINNGVLTLSGTLGDLSSFSQTVPISLNGYVPVYASLYNNTGLVEGWINLAGNGGVAGSLAWIRPSGVAPPPGFPQGFATTLQVSGSTSQTKSFTRVLNYTNPTNWVDVTPIAGNALVVVADCYGTVSPTISDSAGNKWTVIQTVQGSSGTNAVTLMVAAALNVQGAWTRITVPIASETTLEMAEYSGVTAVDAFASASGATLSATVATSSTDMFFAAWLNKAALANTSTSLSPGSVVGKPIRFDTNYYDGQYEWLNGGFGLPANDYTLKLTTSDTNGVWVVVGLR